MLQLRRFIIVFSLGFAFHCDAAPLFWQSFLNFAQGRSSLFYPIPNPPGNPPNTCRDEPGITCKDSDETCCHDPGKQNNQCFNPGGQKVSDCCIGVQAYCYGGQVCDYQDYKGQPIFVGCVNPSQAKR